MEVEITYKSGMDFEAKTSKESFMLEPKKVSPIELFAIGMIGCTGTDIVSLCESQKHTLNYFNLKSEIQRADDMPKKFIDIHLIYEIESDADDLVVTRWTQASIQTYCSTLNTVRDTSKIRYSIIHNKQTIVDNESIISGQGTDNIDLDSIESCPA